MPEYDNTNTVAIWKKGTHPQSPDYRITLNLEGRDFTVALWKNDSDNPKAPALKGTIEPAGQAVAVGAGRAPDEDESPF